MKSINCVVSRREKSITLFYFFWCKNSAKLQLPRWSPDSLCIFNWTQFINIKNKTWFWDAFLLVLSVLSNNFSDISLNVTLLFTFDFFSNCHTVYYVYLIRLDGPSFFFLIRVITLLYYFSRLHMLPATAQGRGPSEYLNSSFKWMLHFCIIIINFGKRFLFATKETPLSVHLYVTHSLNYENVSILILLRRSKKIIRFLNTSSFNKYVPSLK